MLSAMWSPPASSPPPFAIPLPEAAPGVDARPKSADRLCESALAAFSRRNSCEKSVRMSRCRASVCALLSAPARVRRQARAGGRGAQARKRA